jgi:hypothetical protein
MARQILNLSVGVQKNWNKFIMNLIELIMNKFTLIALLASVCLGATVRASTKPNIVFILAYDMNRDYPMMICGGSNLGFQHGSLYEL